MSAHDLVRHPHHTDPELDRRIDALKDTFWVVTAVSNPVRFKTRYALYRKFREHVRDDLRVGLITVEAAYVDREHRAVNDDSRVVTYTDTGIDVRVSNKSQVWLKENLWNVALGVLPRDARYVMFCDADIEFLNRNVVTETIHALQTHKVVMPWETCADLGPTGQIMQVHRSFGFCYDAGWEWKPVAKPVAVSAKKGYGLGYGLGYDYACVPGAGGPKAFGNPWHPGFAMAFRREVLDRMQLLDVGILGAGDHHMCAALIGKAHMSMPGDIHDNYKKRVMAWQALADVHVAGDFGYVPGTITHHFHGPKRARAYISRWRILVENGYDPDRHSYKNAYGVTELADDAPIGLRDGIRKYFAQRNEDSVEAE